MKWVSIVLTRGLGLLQKKVSWHFTFFRASQGKQIQFLSLSKEKERSGEKHLDISASFEVAVDHILL